MFCLSVLFPLFSSLCPCILFCTTLIRHISLPHLFVSLCSPLTNAPLVHYFHLSSASVFIGFYRPFPHSTVMVCVIKIACPGICCIFHMAFIHSMWKKDYGVANQAIKPNGSYNIMGALPLPHIYIQNPVPKVTTRINLQLWQTAWLLVDGFISTKL